MNPVFWLLVLVVAIVIWFFFSFVFIPLGRFIFNRFDSIGDIFEHEDIFIDEHDEDEKERGDKDE